MVGRTCSRDPAHWHAHNFLIKHPGYSSDEAECVRNQILGSECDMYMGQGVGFGVLVTKVVGQGKIKSGI